ncbi:MAG: surface lipoprotein assembly modifier [Sulfitobacter sp.]
MNLLKLHKKLIAFSAAALLCAPLAITFAAPGFAQTNLTAAQLGTLGMQSLQGRNPAQALAIADALLARDAGDMTALLLRARALRDLGQYDAALKTARRGWTLSQSDPDKYAAALVMAQALSSDGKRTRAQLWLRRAVQHAPTPALKGKAARDFNYVRQQNPWNTQVSFTLAPNSNINNGSARETSQLNYVYSELLFGEPVEYVLGGAARALSGLEYGAALHSRYRFNQTETTAHDLHILGSYRSFVLSSSAEDDAPDVSGDDFAYGSLSLGYGYKQITHDGRGEFSLNADLGQSFYGGARYASFLRGRVSQSYRINPRDRLQFSLLGEVQNGQRTSDTERLEFATSLTRQLKTGDNLFFEAAVTRQISDNNRDAEYNQLELRAIYAKAKPVFGAGLQFGLGAALRDYEYSVHDPDGREDTRIFADVTATFHQIDYYGFNPAVTVSASSTDSNIGLFDVNRFGISLGVRSAF